MGLQKSVKTKKGRHLHEVTEAAFLEVVKEMEQNPNKPYTLDELVTLMQYKLPSSDAVEAYSNKHMKRRLIDHFGSRIFIAENCGKSNLITLKLEVSKLVENFYAETKNDNDDDKKTKLIKAAAKLIQNDIALIENKGNSYPSSEDLENKEKCLEFLPESLKTLLDTLIPWTDGALKKAAIGQALIQSARPLSVLAPLQFGLAVQLHQMFGSKMLINSLNEMGFFMSYFETQRFAKSASLIQDFDIPETQDRCIQFIADNVDHNTRTIDGLNTLHGMGMMMTITPKVKKVNKVVPRINVSSKDVASIRKVSIKFNDPAQKVWTTFAKLPQFISYDNTYNIDFLWKMSWRLRPKTPQWNGMMQMVQTGTHPGESTAIFLPIIDMDQNNESCIYSTLSYTSTLAKKYHVDPIITFDQPLWFKAQLLIETEPESSELKRVVCRLGGLHILMSFLGSIGIVMTDSGLKEVLQTVYAENAVPHMLTGKAISRAFRGHLLAETALFALLTSDTFDINMTERDTSNLLDNESISDETVDHSEYQMFGIGDLEDTGENRSHENEFKEDKEAVDTSLRDDVNVAGLESAKVYGRGKRIGHYNRSDIIHDKESRIMTEKSDLNGNNLTGVMVEDDSEHPQTTMRAVETHIDDQRSNSQTDIQQKQKDLKATCSCEWSDNRGPKPDGTEYAFDETDSVEEELLKDAMTLLDKLLLGEIDVLSVEISTTMNKAVQKMKHNISKFNECRTGQLWVEYIEMVDILTRFTKAERTGDWLLHLHALREMLPFFCNYGTQ